jgi:hypothetical protein
MIYCFLYRLSVKIFLSFAIYAWGVLLPINGTGGIYYLYYNLKAIDFNINMNI